MYNDGVSKHVKVSIFLPSAVHRAAKMEALDRGSLTAVIEQIIDSRLDGSRLRRPAHTVDAAAVRPSVLISANKLAAVEDMAGEHFTANSLISQWVREYFERPVSA